MFIGIDVGGTYTDGVAVDNKGTILTSAKYPTDHLQLQTSLLGCLDLVMQGLDPQQVERVAFSTTLLTNAILENKLLRTALAVIPGPGLSLSDQAYGVEPWHLEGAVDFRGREIIPLNLEQVRKLGSVITGAGINTVAVCGKFSPRNNSQELKAAAVLQELCPGVKVELGHSYYGALNFPRRANTTYLTAATRKFYQGFLTSVAGAVKARGIGAPVVILKADGGTLPWETAYRLPVETVYSGPAASVLGVMALKEESESALVIDIGGTTTDLGLILSGTPLYTAKGAEIGKFKTLVRSMAVNSAAVGGDSPVRVCEGQLELEVSRRGPAFCLGGPVATPTDALRYLGQVEHGAADLAQRAMERLAGDLGIDSRQAALRVVELMVDKIYAAVDRMIDSWRNEPAYRVWQVLHSRKLEQLQVIGVGGGVQGIVPRVAERLNAGWEIPCQGRIANALGAALARTTFSCSLRADTAFKIYGVVETGVQREWPYGLGTLAEAKGLLQKHFAEIARELGLENCTGTITREEAFNVVRGFRTSGKIIEVAMERQAGVLARVNGGCLPCSQ